MAVDYEEGRKRHEALKQVRDRYTKECNSEDADDQIGAENDLYEAEQSYLSWCDTHAEAILNPDPWRPRKTAVRVLGTPYQCRAKDGDVGYVDGYVSGANGVPCAVFIAEDGYIELVPVHALVAPHFRELKGPGHA